MATDDESILQAGAAGRPIRDIAAAHGLTEAAVKAIIDRQAEDQLGGAQLRRELLFEVMRLRALGRKYFDKAMDGDGEHNAGLLYIKASERLATLLGMNAPIGHAVQVIHQPAPAELNGTQRLSAAIDRIRGITARERELDDKQSYSDEPLTVDEQAELDQLRAAREAKRAQQDRDTGEDTPPRPH